MFESTRGPFNLLTKTTGKMAALISHWAPRYDLSRAPQSKANVLLAVFRVSVVCLWYRTVILFYVLIDQCWHGSKLGGQRSRATLIRLIRKKIQGAWALRECQLDVTLTPGELLDIIHQVNPSWLGYHLKRFIWMLKYFSNLLSRFHKLEER